MTRRNGPTQRPAGPLRPAHRALGTWALLCLSALGVACSPGPRSSPEVPPQAHATAQEHAPLLLLGDLDQRARAQGAARLELLARGILVSGDSLGGTIEVPPGRCALLVARGARSVGDLDLYAFDFDGTELGRDERPDELPSLLLCPKTSQRAYVAARVAQGMGPVELGLIDLPASRQAQVTRVVGAGRSAQAPDDAWPELDSQLAERRSDLGGDWLDQRRVGVPVDTRLPSHVAATVPADRCLDVLVLPGDDVRDLELEALDEAGRVLGRGAARGRASTLLLCSSGLDFKLALRLRPHAGQGTAWVMLSHTKSSHDRSQLDPEIARVDLLPQPGEEPGSGLSSSPDETWDVSLRVGRLELRRLEIRGCARLDLLPRAPLLGQRTRVHDEAGALRGAARSAGHEVLFVCSRESAGAPASRPGPGPGYRAELRELVRLSTEAVTRGGPLSVEVRHAREVSPALLARPLAGSRLLELAYHAGLIEAPADIGQVSELPLAPEQLARVERSVPAGRCLHLLIAREGGTGGIRADAIDQSGLVLATAVAAHATRLVVCGDEGKTRHFVLELQTSAPGSALLAAHLTELDKGLAPRR